MKHSTLKFPRLGLSLLAALSTAFLAANAWAIEPAQDPQRTFVQPTTKEIATATQEVATQIEAPAADAVVPEAATREEPQDTQTTASTAPRLAAETNGVVTTKLAVTLNQYAGKERLLLHFRPNANMPELTHPALLSGLPTVENIASIEKGSDKWGFIPRIKLLPCNDGCAGNSDYEKLANLFLKTYGEPVRRGKYDYRGEMTVKVRWYKDRGFFTRKVPFSGQDVFAIEFALEGKRVTLSRSSLGSHDEMKGMATFLASNLFLMMAKEVSYGVKPFILQSVMPDYEKATMDKVNDTVAPVVNVLNKLIGNDNYFSRVEPMVDADNVLLPAVDGIHPNEIDPISEMKYGYGS